MPFALQRMNAAASAYIQSGSLLGKQKVCMDIYQVRSAPVMVQSTNRLYLRIERPREILAQLDLILGATSCVIDQSSSGTGDR